MGTQGAANMMTKPCAVFGHHKCGSSWLYNVVGTAGKAAGFTTVYFHSAEQFDFNIQKAFEAACGGILFWLNADYELVRETNVTAVHVIRDPRDIIVSGYFSHRNSHPTEGWPSLLEHRRRLRERDLENGLLAEMEWEETRDNLKRIGRWNYGDSNILEIRYEHLLQDEGLFITMFKFLGLFEGGLRQDDAADAISQHRFEVVTGGRSIGEENPASHFRSGKAGDWKNYFTERLSIRFNQLYGDVLKEAGYDDSV